MAQSKKILFFVSSMQGGGAERVAALLCNHWIERGHEVMLVPTFSGRGECAYQLDDRVSLVYLADKVDTTRKSPLSLLRRFLGMRTLVRDWGPDAVVSFLPNVNVAALLATRGLKVPVVVSERTYPPAMPMGPIWSRLRRWTYPLAATVVMQTQRGEDWLKTESSGSRGVVIPNPCVYPLPISPQGPAASDVVNPTQYVVLAVGRLGEEKGFDLLIQAFSLVAESFPNWDLVILGEGEERSMLEALVTNLGLSGRVLLPGRIGDLAEWYNRAEIYVMSSRFEGFPNTLMEAMAHGLPAVSFDCKTGPADIIRDGIDGVLVPPADGDAGLARAMAEMIQDDDKRRLMGRAAVRVRERFSFAQVMAKWDDLVGLHENGSV
ncbi:glycosyltransferase family 4 protein [Marinobacter alexandrii]|uniref:glycosyltransferase family 4 protein n=1 Tax=Marinobacter alexandrii TaxID=2570351 RepID=UPI001108C258|nr:glycosyltransferase family 4 protein [Marinobacter alexandrii]